MATFMYPLQDVHINVKMVVLVTEVKMSNSGKKYGFQVCFIAGDYRDFFFDTKEIAARTRLTFINAVESSG